MSNHWIVNLLDETLWLDQDNLWRGFMDRFSGLDGG
jgi:hypothetical protein